MNVRRITFDDLDTLKQLRIEVLTDSPAAFASTPEREAALSSDDWRRRIEPTPTYFAEEEGADGPFGLVRAFPHEDDPAALWVASMWVRASHRGTGAADALLQAVLGWALDNGYRTAYLRVAEGNARAERVYERHGFRRTGPHRPQ